MTIVFLCAKDNLLGIQSIDGWRGKRGGGANRDEKPYIPIFFGHSFVTGTWKVNGITKQVLYPVGTVHYG